MKAKYPKSELLSIVHEIIPKRSYRAVLYILIWTLFALLASLKREYLYNQPFPNIWLELIRNKIYIWYLWGGTVALILFIASRFKIQKNHLLKNLLILFGFSVIIVLLFMFIRVIFFYWFYNYNAQDYTLQRLFIDSMGRHFTFYYLFYWVVIGLEYTAKLHRQSVERAVTAVTLKSQLVESQLSNLKNQLHPHFIFNAMHMISDMITTSPKVAQEYLVELGSLLRSSLNLSDTQEVKLSDELSFTESYLHLQKARFSDRLSYDIKVSDELSKAIVPSLSLQPLVENAIKYNVNYSDRPVEIVIESKKENNMLVLSVIDNGQGIDNEILPDTNYGLGLSNLKSRLKTIYENNCSLIVKNNDSGGVSSEIKIPLKLNTTDTH